jgi:hypothetical protein
MAIRRCSITPGSSYALDSDVTVYVADSEDIHCLTLDGFFDGHENATPSFNQERYWRLSAENSSGTPASDFSLNLTIAVPFTPDSTNDLLCRHFHTGSSWAWDCAAHEYSGSTITRNSVTQLSDWAACDECGPTAVLTAEQQVRASSLNVWAGSGLFLLFIILGLGTAVLLRKRHTI